MNKTHIVIHHSATADSGTVSWNAIRRYHVGQGWKNIGYHLGIEWILDAAGHGHYEALIGRPFDEDGAHCSQGSMNRLGLGVVLVGNFDIAAPSEDMLRFSARHVAALCRVLGIPVSHLRRHSDFAPKSCPGTLFPWDRFCALVGAWALAEDQV